nr:hypothetical protein CFP56_78405 [Quercus suber]
MMVVVVVVSATVDVFVVIVLYEFAAGCRTSDGSGVIHSNLETPTGSDILYTTTTTLLISVRQPRWYRL